MGHGAQTLKELRTRGNLRGILTVAAEFLLIAAAIAIALHVDTPYLLPAFLLFIGVRQYALAETLTHEAVHRNLCRTRWLNDLLGILTTWPFFYVLTGYRRYHLDHHRVPLEDPENNIYEQYEAWGLPPPDQPLSRGRALWLFALRPLLGIMAVHHVRTLLSNVYWDRDLIETYLMLAAWALLAVSMVGLGWGDELLLFWILPQLLVIGTLDLWSETADHYRVEGALSRSHLGWAWNRLVAHNIGLHALHHRYPSVPWHKLPAAYRILSGELREERCSGFFDAVRQMVTHGRHRPVPGGP